MSWEPEKSAVVPGKALQSGLQERLDRRFAEAHAAAPLKWYEPARIDEIATPGHAAARRYRVTTALGSFCLTYLKEGEPPVYGLCQSFSF